MKLPDTEITKLFILILLVLLGTIAITFTVNASDGWDRYEGMVTDNMIDAVPGEFCPNYSRINKVKFWVVLTKAIARAESAWDENAHYVEGNGRISYGMMQIHNSVSQYYKGDNCRKINVNSIFNRDLNIKCGMEMEDALLSDNRNVRVALGRYWSVVRYNRNRTDGITLSATVKKYMGECFK